MKKYKTKIYKPGKYRPKRRFRKRKSILKSRLFWDFVLVSILIFLIFYLFFFSEIFKIKEIKVSVPEKVFKKEIESFLGKELGNNLFLANSEEIENEILKRYPEIRTAQLKKNFPENLILEIEKRKPVGIFCSEKESDCFLIDKEGVIFKNLTFQNGTTSEILEDNLIAIFSENQTKILGEKVVSEEEMSQILEIDNELEKNLGIDLEKFILKENERLNLKTEEGWELYFDLSSDINFALTKLHLLLEKEISLEERKGLSYIDLRFSKVYYK